MRLDGTTALVTGGASGIGLAVVRQFIAEGARVAVIDRALDALETIRAELPEVLIIAGDVTSYADNVRAVETTVRELGGLDTFVGNAGIFDHYMTLEGLPADDGGAAAFDELVGIDVKGYLLGAKAALAPLRRARGAIVFTASISGVHPAYGGVLYIPAKHAVVGLTKRLALELAPEIRVNAVAPGFVPTGLSGTRALDQGRKDPTAPRSPEGFLMKRVPQTADYAPLYTFLASNDAITLTGQTLVADNGTTLQKT